MHVYFVVQFYPGFNFYFFSLKLITIHYNTPQKKKIKIKPRDKIEQQQKYLLLVRSKVI